MIQQRLRSSKKPLSLSVRISVLLVLAAILPLLVAVTSSEMLSRPQLISQASTEMTADAQTRVALIDAYLVERIQDVETLSKSTAIRAFLTGDKTQKYEASNSLAIGKQRDAEYVTWSLLDGQTSMPILSYPSTPQIHGKHYIDVADLTQLQQANTSRISSVFYDATKDEASIDIYTPIRSSRLLGIIRASLNLHYIWDIVNRVATDRGNGSYSFIVDQNGVRIAYTNPTNYSYVGSDPAGFSHPKGLFTAIAPLSSQNRQQITQQNLYGNDRKAVGVSADTSLAQTLKQTSPPATFSLTPADQHEAFQVALHTSSIMPWTLLVLSPLSVITAIANQQLLYASMIALFVLILAALIGLGFGRRIASPIMKSVTSLSSSSQSLRTLAQKEQTTATEQRWIIESSQVGLESVRYYTNATNVAARRLGEVSIQLTERWQLLDEKTIMQHLEEIRTTAKYIENAANRQEESSKNLATAIRVTTQVTEQLGAGATSATDASLQLEQVVGQLRTVVGK